MRTSASLYASYALKRVYFAAFCSYAWQFPGLNGSQGIAPVQEFLATVEQSLGPGRFIALPTLAWINSSDSAIQGLAWAGAALALGGLSMNMICPPTLHHLAG